MQFKSIKEKFISLGIDPALLNKPYTGSVSTDLGTLWIKTYNLTVSGLAVLVAIVGSYNGIELGEEGQTVLTLFEPLGNPEDFGMLDVNELMKLIKLEQKSVEVEQEKEKKKRNQQAAIAAQEYISKLKRSGLVNRATSPYLAKKNLPHEPTIMIEGQGEQGTLIIPMVGEHGQIWNFQRITPDGDKYMQKDGRVTGCYHTVRASISNTMFIGEGYATCLSVALALDSANRKANIICCFNSGNIAHVVTAMRKLHPTKMIIVLADNDQWKQKNTGILAAKDSGCPFIAPEFDTSLEIVQQNKPTDFNDIHCLFGLPTLLDQIEKGLEKINTAILTLKEAHKKTEIQPKKEKITEIMVAKAMLSEIGDNIVACGEDLFVWRNEGYWQHLEKGAFAPILLKISDMFGEQSTSKNVNGAFTLLKIRLSQVSPDIFTQKKTLCNFENGTLVFDKGIIQLKPHDKKDLLTYSLPFLCPTSIGALTLDEEWSNPLLANGIEGSFLDLVHGITEGDADKKNLVAEMLGSVLFPIYPQIFFILGKPNNGKSTIAKIALNLVGFKNCSAVEPSRLYGFNLHQTLGKRVNYGIDIPTGRPLVDDVLKKVIDQVPTQIERKNKDSIMATLPPVHIYVGNELPDLGEGNSKPMERRVSFLMVNRDEITSPDKTMVERLLLTEFETVVKAAIWGALSLWKKQGRYSLTTDKKEALTQWELNSSPSIDILDQLKHEGLPIYDEDGRFTGDKIIVKNDEKIGSSILWLAVKKLNPRMGRNKFLQFMHVNGFEYEKGRDNRYFKGLTIARREELE